MVVAFETISVSAIFNNLTLLQREDVLRQMRSYRYDAGRSIFEVGQPATSLFLIQSGLVKVSYLSPDGDNKILNVIDEGDIFGELFLGDYPYRIGSAVAMTESRIYHLSQDMLYNLISTYPQFGMNFIKHLVDSQRRTVAQVHALQRTDAKSRLLGTLLYLSRKMCCHNGHQFVLNPAITQQDLADMTGLNRSTVSTLINRLRKNNILGGEGRELLVDVDGIKDILWDEGFELLT